MSLHSLSHLVAFRLLVAVAGVMAAAGCSGSGPGENASAESTRDVPQGAAPSPESHGHPAGSLVSGGKPDGQDAVIPPIDHGVPPVRAATSDDLFEDVTAATGVDFRFTPGWDTKTYSMLESFGGGVALVDYDNDGDCGLAFAAGGKIARDLTMTGAPLRIYRNDGGFRFSDVSSPCGLAGMTIDYSHGISAADFDRDGWKDLFVTCYGRSRLLRNDKGRFVDVTHTCGIDLVGWSTSSAWGDLNRDGWPDLYVCGYLQWAPSPGEWCGENGVRDVCAPRDLPAAPDHIYLNRRDGTFEDATKAAQLRSDGKGMGVALADLDGNGWLDIYVANDVSANHLYLNSGTFPFEESAAINGVSGNEVGVPEGSMGVDVGDFDGDGRPDLFVTNYETEDNSLYRNMGEGLFSHAAVTTGLAGVSRPWVGFGTEFLDFDLDGWLDLYVLNGHVVYQGRRSSFRQPCQLFRNEQGTRFKEVSDRGGPWFGSWHIGRGGGVGDLDGDGAVDLVLVDQETGVAILKNRRSPAPQEWVGYELVGTTSDPGAVGATLTVPLGDRKLTRIVHGGGGYLSQSDARIIVPVKAGEQAPAIVHWPSGLVETFSAQEPGQVHRLVEGTGSKSSLETPDALEPGSVKP